MKYQDFPRHANLLSSEDTIFILREDITVVMATSAQPIGKEHHSISPSVSVLWFNFILGLFFFSFVSNSLSYITITQKQMKLKKI